MNQSSTINEITSPILLYALIRLASLQREAVDRLALQEASTAALSVSTPEKQLDIVANHLQVKSAKWRKQPDEADLPALIASPDGDWGILRSRDASGQWIADWFNTITNQWEEKAHHAYPDFRFATIRMIPPYRASKSPVLRLVLDELFSHKAILIETSIGGLLLAFLGILISFYSMQIYDRVIPTGAMQTLLVLTFGIVFIIGLEYAAKRLRSNLYDRLIDAVDQRLARTVYMKFLAIRLDQLPSSVGTMAGQLRGYESVRSFLVSLSTHLAVDAPFAIFFLIIIASIAGPLAYVPLFFLVIALIVGFWHGGKMRQIANRSQSAANLKTGLLVETVEASEIIKSGQGGWRMLGRWLASTDESRNLDLDMRHINEITQYRAMALQQISYVLLVAIGAWMASEGQISMGGLIATSILSGRVLNPVTQISMQLVAWANVKASLQGLDALWKLQDDHHGLDQPVYLEKIRGDWRIEDAQMNLNGKAALKITKLNITSGEKIGILGPIGAGKTTLLRMLSGMYKPNEGRIWLDDVDLAHISKPLLAENIGYLPQDGRLISGTLRDNLLLGLNDPGDETILDVAKITGLYESVIATHSSGLQQEIYEGGTGLSGGQRQLVNLTRVFLRNPSVWLLDEPTASLDRNLELQLINALKKRLTPQDNLVLVTHKPEMLELVDRLIVIGGGQMILDGPRDAVLARLQAIQVESNSTQGEKL